MLLPRGSAVQAVLILATPALVANPPPSEVDESGQGWSLVRMDIDVALDPAAATFELRGELRLRLDLEASQGPTLGVNLNEPILRFEEVLAEGATVELNARFPPLRPARLAHVRYEQPKRRGDEVDVVYRCTGEGRAYQLVVGDSIALASWVESWYPIPMPRGATSFSAAIASAPGTTSFTVPEGWTAVSNGRRTRKEGGRVVWETQVPMARSFAAGPFEEGVHATDGREIGVFLLKPKPTAASDHARILSRAIGAMEKRFGPYPFASYAIVELPLGVVEWYASSEQGFIMADSSAFDVEGGNLPLFAHEAAHGWWGNRLGSSGPAGKLCSESLAQYGAVVAIEEIEGEPAATEFLRFSRKGYSSEQCARGYFGVWRQGNDKALSQLGGGSVDHTLSDSKGHWVFHMLRHRVGDETFFRTLRSFLEDRSRSSLTLDELRSAFVAAAPAARLERFFSEWLDRPGAPVLALVWSDASDASGPRVRIAIGQRDEPYDLDLEVEVAGSEGTERHTIRVKEAKGEWRLPSRGAPRGVTLDPRHRLLLWTPEYGEEPAGKGG